MSERPAKGAVLYRHKWLTPPRQAVVDDAESLQRSLVHKGYYKAIIKPEESLYKQALWILRGLLAIEATGVWCPEAKIVIEG